MRYVRFQIVKKKYQIISLLFFRKPFSSDNLLQNVKKVYNIPERVDRISYKSLDDLKHLWMYGLLTKCEVKMAGYWLSSFFCVNW